MVRTSRRQALGFIAALAASSVLPAAAQTTPFPSRPIRLIVPQAPGGNSDTFGRILAQKLTDRLGQQVVVENRAGAGGTVGSALVSKAAPDGYTLLVADNGTHAIAPTLYGAKLPYDVYRDFTPITLAATFPTVIMIHPSVPAQTVQEFVALAKSQPGKITYSSAGTGNGSHLTVELFRAAAGGLDLVHVPYKGGAPAVQALLSGEVQLSSVSVNTALPHIQAGKVRALGVASAKRSPALPDVPTFAENGIAVRSRQLAGHHGPARHPGRRRHKAQPGDRRRAPRARDAGTPGQARPGRGRLVAGRAHRNPAARRPQVGQGRQGLGRRRGIADGERWQSGDQPGEFPQFPQAYANQGYGADPVSVGFSAHSQRRLADSAGIPARAGTARAPVRRERAAAAIESST